MSRGDDGGAARIFIVAGEHSGDALGGKLMQALKQRGGAPLVFAGVGGAEMAAEGLSSLFPIEDVAVMGPQHIIPALPRLISRVYQTVAAAVAFQPDAVVIIDSPEFTHPIAMRIRNRAPHIPIIDYVSPSVWAWRPGRAKKMRAYVDEVLALLPFEPEAHLRLGGPHCTYVGHPLIEKLSQIRNADSAGLAKRLGLDPSHPLLLVLPGSRRSEVDRLISVFGETVSRLKDEGGVFDVIIPAVAHVREKIVAQVATWPVTVHLTDTTADKFAAMRLSRAALAASGTVTLELALAGLPMVVAYKVDRLTAAVVRRLIKVDTAVLANLVLGSERPFPQFIQEDCTAENLARAVSGLLYDGAERRAQLDALARVPQQLESPAGTPSEAAANVVLGVLGAAHSRGKSRRPGPT